MTSPTEWWGTCPRCWVADLYPVVEADGDQVAVACSCGPFWVTLHDPGKEPE